MRTSRFFLVSALAPALAAAALTLAAAPALAHFGMVIPSQDTVADKAKAKVELAVSFSHPMERLFS